MLKILCQNYTCSYPMHFATTNYLRTFEVFQEHTNFCCFIHIIYTHAHRRANLTSRTHLHLKRNFHAIYLHLRGNSTSYIHSGSILVPFLTWVHFLKGSLCYLYTYFERHFYATYCHTLISSGDYYLMICNLWSAALRYLASFVSQYVKSQDMPEIKRKQAYAIREIP